MNCCRPCNSHNSLTFILNLGSSFCESGVYKVLSVVATAAGSATLASRGSETAKSRVPEAMVPTL